MFGDPVTNPKGWRIEKLEDVCSTTSGGTPDRNNGNYFGGGIPWVKSGELNQKIILKTEECLTDAGLQNSSAKLQPPGTILLAMYGATVGAVAILGIHASTNQAICCIQTGSHLVTDYLYALIKISTPMFLNQRVGGAQPNISQKIIRNMQIPIPRFPSNVLFPPASPASGRLMRTRPPRAALDDLFQSLLHRAFQGEF
jgi:type I restriction enzyme S subunit